MDNPAPAPSHAATETTTVAASSSSTTTDNELAIPAHGDSGIANQHQHTERPSARRVRMVFMRSAWHRISRARRVVVLSSIMIVIAQLVSIIIALVDPSSARCSRPLDIFLIIYLLRSVLNLPLVVYHHLRLGRASRQDNAEIDQQGIEWTDRAKSLFDIFGIVWFIIGNYFIFSSGQCARDAPTLFYTALVWILLGYLFVLIPLFICISAIFCLPCVLVLMRMLRLGYTPDATGASKEQVSAIPVFRYSPPDDDNDADELTTEVDQEAAQQQTSSSKHQHQHQNKARRKRYWFLGRLLRRRPADGASASTDMDPITITPTEDAMCSICLSEYEQDDLICKLWCCHHFHKECVHEWLLLNASCPLCKRDFRTKDQEGDSADRDGGGGDDAV